MSSRSGRASALPFLLVLGLLLAACGGNQQAPNSTGGADAAAAGAAGATPFVMSYSNLTPDQWALWIAQDLGIFSRHGLDVDLRLVESSTGVAALIAGETQAGAMGGSEVMSAAAEGAELAIVGSLVKTFSFRFMAPESIRSVADLRGKRLGVSRFGSSSDIATRLALENLGLVPNRDVDIVQVGSLTARIQAMESGAIQGGVVQPPDTARVAKSGYHVVFDVSDLGIPAATSVIAVRRADLASRRPALQALVDAIVEASAIQRTDREASEAVLARWLQVDDPAALDEAWEFYAQKIVPTIPRVEPAQLESAKAVLAPDNPRVASYDPAQLIDNSLMDDAAARGIGAPKNGQ
jgi:NitT/TauT family transport system substrate-binding protein